MFTFGYRKLDLDGSLTGTATKYGTVELHFCAVVFIISLFNYTTLYIIYKTILYVIYNIYKMHVISSSSQKQTGKRIIKLPILLSVQM